MQAVCPGAVRKLWKMAELISRLVGLFKPAQRDRRRILANGVMER